MTIAIHATLINMTAEILSISGNSYLFPPSIHIDIPPLHIFPLKTRFSSSIHIDVMPFIFFLSRRVGEVCMYAKWVYKNTHIENADSMRIKISINNDISEIISKTHIDNTSTDSYTFRLHECPGACFSVPEHLVRRSGWWC